jgi:hypothetical protein
MHGCWCSYGTGADDSQSCIRDRGYVWGSPRLSRRTHCDGVTTCQERGTRGAHTLHCLPVMADATAGASSVPTSSALHAASRHKLQLRLERRRRDAAERGGAAAETSTAGLARQRHRCWDVLRGAVARTEVERGSAALLRVSAALPPEQLEYGGVAWSASRTYIDEGRRCCEGGSRDGSGGEALAAAFEPLVEGVQNAVRRRFARRVSRFTSHLCVRQRVRVCVCGCARVCCRRSATVGASCDWRAPSRLCAGALEDRERSQPLRSGRLRI